MSLQSSDINYQSTLANFLLLQAGSIDMRHDPWTWQLKTNQPFHKDSQTVQWIPHHFSSIRQTGSIGRGHGFDETDGWRQKLNTNTKSNDSSPPNASGTDYGVNRSGVWLNTSRQIQARSPTMPAPTSISGTWPLHPKPRDFRLPYLARNHVILVSSRCVLSGIGLWTRCHETVPIFKFTILPAFTVHPQ